jgi:hypothetical protein
MDKPTWDVKVTRHAVQRWLQRYGSRDDKEMAIQALERRIICALKAKYEMRPMKSETIRRKFCSEESEQYRDKGRIEVGDLMLVYERKALSVTIITVW